MIQERTTTWVIKNISVIGVRKDLYCWYNYIVVNKNYHVYRICKM